MASMKEKQGEFYKNDIAYLLISNQGGKEVFAEVKVLDRVNEFGHLRYLIEPIKGRGQMKVEKLYEKDTK